MPAVLEPVVKNGAVLVRKLAETGTGQAKLDPCRKKLADVHRSEQGRVAGADEILKVLQGEDKSYAEEPAPEGTLAKAKTIIETGEWHGPSNVLEVPIEVTLLGDDEVAKWKASQPVVGPPKAPEQVAAQRENAPGVFNSPVDPAFAPPASTVGPLKTKAK